MRLQNGASTNANIRFSSDLSNQTIFHISCSIRHTTKINIFRTQEIFINYSLHTFEKKGLYTFKISFFFYFVL
uniref:Uncharacterized protein n=1 Tax=Helianthus annuus TaxID=4232 RepID=A0A251TY46_HELAN